jgi:hypothetical protein
MKPRTKSQQAHSVGSGNADFLPVSCYIPRARNRLVAGSSPAGPTTFLKLPRLANQLSGPHRGILSSCCDWVTPHQRLLAKIDLSAPGGRVWVARSDYP